MFLVKRLYIKMERIMYVEMINHDMLIKSRLQSTQNSANGGRHGACCGVHQGARSVQVDTWWSCILHRRR